MMRLFFFIFFFMVIHVYVSAQKEANNWYFGHNAAIQFGTGPSPVAISPSAIFTTEGCASISDSAGNLLFYTDGITVWNKNHATMPNGYGLMGDPSSTQSGVIIPYPGSDSLYYVFTVDEESGPDGFRYSIVDMSLQGGMGDVNGSKNILLLNQTTEKVTATIHENGTDYWVVTHEFLTDAFYAYLITPSGIDTIPVITNIGAVHNGIVQNTIGYMKISPKGDKIALCVDYASWMEIFDFDHSTGIISHPVIDYNFTGVGAYGLEFSPNGRFLYVGEEGGGNIYQYDLQAGSDSLIIATRVIIATLPGSIGAIQAGPDKKVYFTQYNYNFLGQIANPDLPGTACNLQQNAIPLFGTTTFGLPNFNASFFSPYILHANNCINDTIFFNLLNGNGISNLVWNFGDPASGAMDTASMAATYHLFSSAGNFHVTLTFSYNGITDTLVKDISVLGPPAVELGNDTNICNGTAVILYSNNTGNTVTWNDGSHADTLVVNSPGTYAVNIQNSCGISADSITIDVISGPYVKLANDTLLCDQTNFLIDATSPLPGISYLWQDSSLSPVFSATQSGLYVVELKNNCGSAIDSIQLTFDIAPSISLGNDTTLCSGEFIYLDFNNLPYQFVWQDGSQLPFDTLSQTGTYYLTASTKCGVTTDTIIVQFQLCENCFTVPNVFTPNNDGLNDEFSPDIKCAVIDYDLQIFNRWGELMFSTGNQVEKWNGQKNKINCPEGVYFYLTHFRLSNPKNTAIYQSKGNFTLIR